MPTPPARIFVAGHRGLVGSAIVRALRAAGWPEPITAPRSELDLADAVAVQKFFARERPEAVFLAAARVGGIRANDIYRWDFLYQNLVIETSVLSAALESATERVIFFGSSCIYPREAPQPISEDSLLSGPLESTNEPYAIAKIAGLKLVESANRQFGKQWVSLMPTNLYGPGDNFDLETSHVLPSLIRKFHEASHQSENSFASTVKLWGTGTPRREFLHVDDLARAALVMLENRVTGVFNVGAGTDVTIRELAELVRDVVGYSGSVEWDSSRPDGTPRKLLDSSRMKSLGWAPQIELRDGIRSVYEWYLAHAPATQGT